MTTALLLAAELLLATAAVPPAPAPPAAAEPAPPPPPAAAAVTPAPSAPAAAGVRGPGPVLWSWQPPLGRAAADRRILEMVRTKTGLDPEAAADEIVRQIRRRGLRPGEVAIVLQNFGMGAGDPDGFFAEGPPLFGHWADGLAHRERPESDPARERLAERDADPRWWDTVWMRHGIAASRAWMDRFIARYRRLQALDPSIPDPDRFHFDVEERVSAHRKFAPATFDAMRRDPRWDAEPVPGFDGRTLAELYREAGAPEVDREHEYYRPPNRAWAAWFQRIATTACEAALDEAAYTPIRAAWPRARSSNYSTSARVDGAGDPPRRLRHHRHRWLAWWWEAFGDLQAPVLYVPRHVPRTAGESVEDALVRRSHELLALYVHSVERTDAGDLRHPITPWILPPGYRVPGRDGIDVIGIEYVARQFEVLRAWGVDELILWSDRSTQRPGHAWDVVPALVDGTWGTTLAEARSGGAPVADARRTLATHAHGAAVIASRAEGGRHVAELEVRFDLPPAWRAQPPARLRLVVATLDGPARVDAGSSFVARPGPDARTRILERASGAPVAIEDGRLACTLRWTDARPFEVEVDLVMATAFPPTR